MSVDDIRAQIEALDGEIRSLHQDEAGELRSLTDDEQASFDEKLAARKGLVVLLERHEAVEGAVKVPERRVDPAGSPQVIRTADPYEVLEDRSATARQLADAATRALEDKVESPENMAHVRAVLKRHAGDRHWARNLIARTHDTYVSAWAKLMTGREWAMSEEERAAMAVGTNTAGGFLVPTHLDPSIILTNDGSSNAIRGISRVVTLTDGSVWSGVTSAGVTASWDAELAEVSDDSPSVARVSVPTYKAQAFAQYSVEAEQDVNGLASDILMMFADAKDRIEGAAHATGSGSAQPTGIFTALDANTNVEVTSTTAATIGLVDLQGIYRAVPVRWRGRSQWLMNPLYLGAIQALGTAVSASYSTDLTQAYTGNILGRPVVESDDAPTSQTTTVRDNELVFGDFGSSFIIVDKPGSMSTEFIPHLFNTSNNLPDGRRGVIAYWRTGSDSVNDVAFRLLQDKTSA